MRRNAQVIMQTIRWMSNGLRKPGVPGNGQEAKRQGISRSSRRRLPTSARFLPVYLLIFWAAILLLESLPFRRRAAYNPTAPMPSKVNVDGSGTT